MKRILLLTYTILLCTTAAMAQSKPLKEGKATFAITFSGNENMLASVMGKQQVIYFKDSSCRIESTTSMGNVVVLKKAGAGEYYTLMDMLGEKTALKMTDVDISSFTEGATGSVKPQVELVKGKKKIAGYDCKKAVITTTVKGEKVISEVWYTDEIIPVIGAVQGKIEGVPGFAMEYTVDAKGTKVIMTCTSVEKAKITDDMFKVPDDYTIKNMSDLMNMMPGGDH